MSGESFESRSVQSIIADMKMIIKDFVLASNDELGTDSPFTSKLKQGYSTQLKKLMYPYIRLSHSATRWLHKPRGYAGDYLMLEGMYNNQPQGTGAIGKALDEIFLDMQAPRAARSRKRLITDKIKTLVEQSPSEIKVTSLACGSAKEIFQVYEELTDPQKLKCNLVDSDIQALSYIDEQVGRNTKIKKQIRVINADLIKLVLGKNRMVLEPQDYIYSVGLIDYFDDKLVVSMMNFMHSLLKIKGHVTLGNFHTSSPGKYLMDEIFEWRLTYRSEQDMDRLFEKSAFSSKATAHSFEQEKINLFSDCKKEKNAFEDDRRKATRRLLDRRASKKDIIFR